MRNFCFRIIFIYVLQLILSCSSVDQPLSLGYWNVENLFDTINDPNINDDEFSIGGKKNVTEEIYKLKLAHTAEVLTDLNADVVGLSEVENAFVVEDLLNNYMDRKYNYIHYDSPDERGIDNALIYDKNKFKIISSRPIKNPLLNNARTRDILLVQGKYNGHMISIFVCHWPSNYGGAEQAKSKRAATAVLMKNEVKKILDKDPKAEIVILGDFNEEPTANNVQSLKSAGLVNLMDPMVGKAKTGTYVFRGEDSLVDQIIIHNNLKDNYGLTIESESVYILDRPKYRQQEGRYAHYPFRFWAGNRLLGGYSDHLAIRVLIKSKNVSIR